MRALKTHQFAEDAGPLAHPVRPDSYIEINNFYTSTVYEKGAEVVRMIATILGRDGFRQGMDLYFERHDGEAATVEEFVTCFEDASGADLSQFRLWYSQAGTPELVANLRYDKDKKTADLEVEQILPADAGRSRTRSRCTSRSGSACSAPTATRSISSSTTAKSCHRRRRVAVTKRAADASASPMCPRAPVPSLLRGFSAPVNVTIDLPDDDARVPDGQRQRSVQPLAGRQQLRRRARWSRS